MARSVVDPGHVGLRVPLAGGWSEGVQPSELSGAVDSSLRPAPAQTVDLGAGFVVPTRRNALHTIEAPVTVAGHIEHWILDTGANISDSIR